MTAPSPTPAAAPDPAKQRGELIKVMAAAATAANNAKRGDLVKKLQSATARLTSSGARVAVVGELKKGKSSVVTSLVGGAVCPVDDDISTAVPTVLRYADKLS